MPATDHDPLPRNGGNTGLPTFMVTMLRLACILTAKEPERREISTRQLSRLMNRHHIHLPQTYTAKAITEQLHYYGSEMSGAGVKVSWNQIMLKDGRKMALYQFAMERTYEPDPTPAG